MSWLVIGGGISGISAAKLLKKLGHDVVVSDVKNLAEPVSNQLKKMGIRVVIGPQEAELLDGIKGIIQSPGVPSELKILEVAKEKAIPVKSEIDLALQHFGGEIVGITGTNGKSTTCAMTAHALNRAGKTAIACGNIGRPPCDLVYAGENYDVWVIELSSYQLETSRTIKPNVAIFTSFTQDHLKRHKNMAGYFRAKWKLFSNIPQDGMALLSQEAYEAARTFKESISNCHHQKVVRPMEPGLFPHATIWTKHDFLNASFALETTAFLLGQPLDETYSYISDFIPLAHRCEKIGTLGGEPVINDSKSTNVDATIKALESQDKPCLLMLGGQAKEESFAPIDKFSDKISKVICFGASADEIKSQLSSAIAIEKYQSLKQALRAIKSESAKFPAPILFSPGCASFDEFSNFEERGNFFKHELEAILDRTR